MLFSSVSFLFYFFPLFLALYYLLPWKNGVLLLFSLVFYAWGEPRFVLVLVASSLLNWSMGRWLSEEGSRRWKLAAGVAVNLALLFYFKYLAFFTQGVNWLTGAKLGLPEIVLPLGISFFTFQGISYLVDVYRGDVAAQRGFWRFFTYKAMFPQLIAGPIVRYREVASEMAQRSLSNRQVASGFGLFIVGLSQKVLIANTVAQPADALFRADPAQLGPVAAWIGLACYSIQILFDFAGYSNMAIGMGRMLGFQYPANFDRPYTARSITEFWRRWHMSLSRWFRDYVYLPLGGNRVSPARTYAHLALVFLLCGLWHGAAMTFVVWGVWHGLLLILERAVLGRRLQAWPALLAQTYTLLGVMIGWVFFRASDLGGALNYLKAMAGFASQPAMHSWQADFQSLHAWALAAGVGIALGPVLPTAVPRSVRVAGAALGLLACSASLAAGTFNPFIYFHF